MNEVIQPRNRKRYPGRRRPAAASRQVSMAQLPSIDWTAVFAYLPQEPAKTLPDAVWNAYKDKGWVKYKPEGRLGFELARMVARDPEVPDWAKLLANIVAGFFVVDGFNATVEGVRKDAERARTMARINAPAPLLLPAWPSKH
jgi:hypothetical protein